MKSDILFRVLIVDDHPLMIKAYEEALASHSFYEINITAALSFEKAFEIITDKNHDSAFDLVLLDISMPAFKAQHIHSGEDLGLLIRKYQPKAKIIILTSHTESFLLYNVLKSVGPEGLLIKSDFNRTELLCAFDTIIEEEHYYSETLRENIKGILSNDIFLNTHNRQIVLSLAKGIQTKNLPDYVPLSHRTIEKRKAEIKTALGIEKGNDQHIITEAKRLGFI